LQVLENFWQVPAGSGSFNVFYGLELESRLICQQHLWTESVLNYKSVF